MRIVEPSVTLVPEDISPLQRIEVCGRVCYQSQRAVITDDSALSFVRRLIDRGHTSVLEHFRMEISRQGDVYEIRQRLLEMDTRKASAIMGRMATLGGTLAINARDYLALFPDADARELDLKCNAADYATLVITCDRGIANELVRHRVFSFSQESTRYVNYKGDGVTFVSPIPFGDPERLAIWEKQMAAAEAAYLELIEKGAAPQEARNVLPLSTKTQLVMTGTFEQWKEMLTLRGAPDAHPQMRHLAEMIRGALLPVAEEVFV